MVMVVQYPHFKRSPPPLAVSQSPRPGLPRFLGWFSVVVHVFVCMCCVVGEVHAQWRIQGGGGGGAGGPPPMHTHTHTACTGHTQFFFRLSTVDPTCIGCSDTEKSYKAGLEVDLLQRQRSIIVLVVH